MNEVTIRLQGGLGNYMFQISCAYAYGLKHDKKSVFSTDDSMIAHKHITNYNENVLNNVELVPNWNHAGFKVHNELGFNYNEIPNIDGDVFLNGYFQSEKYFMEYGDEIKNLFALPSHIFDDVVKTALDSYKIDLSQDNTCSIHVRRGDYLKLPDHHPTQNMNYYMKAIKQMPKDSKFLIFSDDIQWCKENFPDIPEKFVFIEGGQDYEDLYHLSGLALLMLVIIQKIYIVKIGLKYKK